uniref:EIF-3c_N domain-containing protein n=1 Tax=Heterorhabditis bacteriophora TaxID=37862 RepID=A0A1I7WGL2_HETBA
MSKFFKGAVSSDSSSESDASDDDVVQEVQQNKRITIVFKFSFIFFKYICSILIKYSVFRYHYLNSDKDAKLVCYTFYPVVTISITDFWLNMCNPGGCEFRFFKAFSCCTFYTGLLKVRKEFRGDDTGGADDKKAGRRKQRDQQNRQKALDFIDDEDDGEGEWTPITKEKQVQLFEPKQDVTHEAMISKLTEVMASRGRLGTNRKHHVRLLQELYKIAEEILYNRTICQLGLCAFRHGFIKEAHQGLSEIQNTQRAKELLAQAVAMRQHERTAEQVSM